MFNLILFGPPGSGKGTQSENIIAANGLQHLSTGNLLRSEITHQTPLGLKAKNFMDAGQLVPDEVVIGMVDNFMNAHPEAQGFLFDGFPRTTAQCIALDALLQNKGTEINVVLALEVGEEELVKRLLERGKISGRADDASEDTIKNRIAVYNKETSVLVDFYGEQLVNHLLGHKYTRNSGEATMRSLAKLIFPE